MKHFGFFHFAGLTIVKTGFYPKSRCIRGVALFALFHTVIGLVIQLVINKV